MSILKKLIGYAVDDDILKTIECHDSLFSLNFTQNYEVTKE